MQKKKKKTLRYWWMDEVRMKLKTKRHPISWSRKTNGWTGRWNREHQMCECHGLMKAADG
jgi:hypothetical protein